MILKAALKREGYEFEEVDIKSDEGQKLASEFMVRTVPSLFVNGDYHMMGATEVIPFLKKFGETVEDSEQDVNQLLADVTVFNKYAKFIPSQNRRETWSELVTRNMEMHIRKYPKIEGEIRDAYESVYKKRVLPSMRSMQFGGAPIEMANNRIYNCAYMPIDHVDAFSELMFLLLGGTGGGYSVQERHVSKLPKIRGVLESDRKFLVSDTIEGWADTIKVLVEAYTQGKHSPKFDFRDIREKGAALITSGGKAPGPEPLKACVESLTEILVNATGRKLTTLEVHDMCCIIADAVLSGGIRRAALISLFDKNDEKMLRSKSGYDCEVIFQTREEEFTYFNIEYKTTDDQWLHREIKVDNRDSYTKSMIEGGRCEWYHVEPQRARANNSATLVRGVVGKNEFLQLMVKVKNSGSGEPGIYWTFDPDWGTNPCCEIALRAFQFCNLCELSAHDIKDQADFNARAKAAAFIGTLQAGYTDFHYLRPIWRETTEKDALIGVGITGIGSNSIDHLNESEAAEVVLLENERVAKLININIAARTTTIKPSGTSSLTLGSSSGVHAWHNDYYIRRMRMGKDEALAKHLQRYLPNMIEQDAHVENGLVASFPQKAPKGAMLRTESAEETLKRVRRYNTQWVHKGHRDGVNTHNVSCTISLKDNEWEMCANWMWENRDLYNGISVLPYNGGTYLQAPFEDITKQHYKNLVKDFYALDLTKVEEFDDNTDLSGEAACAAGGCEA